MKVSVFFSWGQGGEAPCGLFFRAFGGRKDFGSEEAPV